MECNQITLSNYMMIVRFKNIKMSKKQTQHIKYDHIFIHFYVKVLGNDPTMIPS